ncbi:hypothetical protein KC19_7G078400 [Ceratodon purpureus]|uniref:Lipoxygenase n=1 Tax=Ceratodon purpureus TaxID=3225 RepID=A0A8T0H8E0_CERPU|nr:hypothetical protein KC19_7G078400 [Ceratodon purpureus]
MLLTQLKCTGSSASAFNGARDGFVARKPMLQQPVSLQVRATTSEQPSAGWLESVASKIGQVGGYVTGTKPNGHATEFVAGGDMVTYYGKAVIMKKLKVLDLMDRIADIQDDASELLGGKHVSVQLISAEKDPNTGKALVSSEVNFDGWVKIFDALAAEDLTFQLKFLVPKSFGVPGAILVKNSHPNEFLLEKFTVDLPDKSTCHFFTNSWIYNTDSTGEGRIFFRSTAYLPDETPDTLKELREKELENLRGDGTGERQASDRIYDYDVYNDLGRPDDDPALKRPTLGGNPELPFPRRMRTGRPPSNTDPNCETRKSKGPFYIPRDECFDRTKMSDFMADGFRSIGHSVKSTVESLITKKTEFDSLKEIHTLFAKKGHDVGGINNVLPEMADVPKCDQHPMVFLEEVLRPDGKTAHPLFYPLPQVLQVDENAWQSNEEFAREFLAGVNPVMIQLVTEFPLKSSLDPAEYGDPVSAISSKHIDGQLDGLSVEDALAKKKLFVVDYHDAYLPFVARINAQKNSATYATRALFFLRDDDTLKTLALELVLPPKTPGGEKISRVFTPPVDTSKTDFLWECAKVHVQNNDITAHQVFSHFTNCHAATEAVIIASNRQLSKLHPIYQLMAPHFKCTLEINRQARGSLISAGGSIEQHFTTRAYSLEMAGVHYRETWTFETQALPKDLIRRGMAVEDPSAKHGVRLVVEDYPYAADGLELWEAIKSWNTEYVDIFYKNDGDVQRDVELMNWWSEIRNKAHADKKDAPGWPELTSRESLAEILTTLQWIPSAQHAAVNFGQYDFVAFMPHHPTVTRRLVPEEGTEEWQEFQRNPEKFFLSTISNIPSTTTAMSVYEVLSAHSPNEEYIGQRDPHWTECNNVRAAFKRFCGKLSEVDRTIMARNENPKLKNRLGVVQMPYQLLRPHSVPGVTSMGVPNSITI